LSHGWSRSRGLQGATALNLIPFPIPASSERLRSEMAKLPPPRSIMCSAGPALQPQLNGRLKRPDESHVEASTTTGQVLSFAAYDDLTRAWMLAGRRVMKALGTCGRDRSYTYFASAPRHVGLGLWVSTTSCGADQPDAEFPRPPVHQRPRGPDRARRGREGQGLEVSTMRALKEPTRSPGTLRLDDPTMHRRVTH